jgi:2-polyprenyl-3-methyl-5-hydroxy-6-metoxy-1,4-benzoquinol methylase
MTIKQGGKVLGVVHMDYTKQTEIWDPVGMKVNISPLGDIEIDLQEITKDGMVPAKPILVMPDDAATVYSKTPVGPRGNKSVPPQINLVTTIGVKCGIATYSEFLSEALKLKFPIKSYRKPTEIDVPGLIHVQHEFGIFPHMDELITRQLETSYGVVTWHTVFRDPGPQVDVYQALDAIYDGHIVHNALAKKWLSQYVSKPIFIIPHGSQHIAPVPQRWARRDLGLPESMRMVFLFGFAADSKGFAQVAEAASKLTSVEFYISGAIHGVVEEHSEDAHKRITEALGPNVHLIGKYLSEEEIDKWAQASDILLFNYNTPPGVSSASGALHRVLWACKPIICTDDNRMVDLTDGLNCLKYKHGDMSEMLRLIVLVLGDKDIYKALASGAHDLAHATRWDAIADMHLKAYGQTIGQVFGSTYYDEEYYVGANGGKVHNPEAGKDGHWSYYNTTGEWLGAEDVMKGIQTVLQPKNILDVGCGRGTFVGWGRRLGMDMIGIDFSHWAIQHPYPAAGGHIHWGDATDIKCADQSFDLVVAFDIMEHIYSEDLEKVVSELRRTSKRFIMYNIAVCEPAERYDLRKNQLPDKKQMTTAVPGHVHMETHEYWETHLCRDGWKSRPDLVTAFRAMVPPDVLGNWKCIIIAEKTG